MNLDNFLILTAKHIRFWFIILKFKYQKFNFATCRRLEIIHTVIKKTISLPPILGGLLKYLNKNGRKNSGTIFRGRGHGIRGYTV